MTEFRLAKHIKPDKQGRIILTWETFHKMDNQELWDSILNDPELLIDLSNITILNHDGLIWISYICLARKSKGLQSFIMLPEEDDQISYLKSLNVDGLGNQLNYSFINEINLIYSSSDKYEYKDKNISYLTKIHYLNRNNWSSIANSSTSKISDYLREEYGIEDLFESYKIVKPFIDTIQELIHNIGLHAGVEEGEGEGLVCFKPPPKGFPIIRYCCNDIGAGYSKTLLMKHNIESHNNREAIINALLHRYFYPKEGINGLYNTLKFIRDRLGTLTIISDGISSKINFNNEKVTQIFDEQFKWLSNEILEKLFKFRDFPKIIGTHILVELKLPE